MFRGYVNKHKLNLDLDLHFRGYSSKTDIDSLAYLCKCYVLSPIGLYRLLRCMRSLIFHWYLPLIKRRLVGMELLSKMIRSTKH